MKKRKFDVEQHFDDCGRDDSSLKDALWSMAPETLYLDEALRDRDDDSELLDELVQSCLSGFHGADPHPYFRADGKERHGRHRKHHSTDLHLPAQGKADAGKAVLFGGDARTSLVLVHRYHHIKVGKNFDITAGIDLLSRERGRSTIELLGTESSARDDYERSLHWQGRMAALEQEAGIENL